MSGSPETCDGLAQFGSKGSSRALAEFEPLAAKEGNLAQMRTFAASLVGRCSRFEAEVDHYNII